MVENLEIFWLKPQAHWNIRSNLYCFFSTTVFFCLLLWICVQIITSQHLQIFITWLWDPKCLPRYDVRVEHNNTWQIVKLMPCILTKDNKRHVNQHFQRCVLQPSLILQWMSDKTSSSRTADKSVLWFCWFKLMYFGCFSEVTNISFRRYHFFLCLENDTHTKASLTLT